MPGRSLVTAQRSRLDATFNRISILPEEQLEIRADFARYLCVLVSGFVESVVSAIALDYCRRRSSLTVVNFVESRLGRTGNLNTEQLLQFVGSFDPDWRSQLERFVAGKRKDALDSVVANRNKIAHGESIGLTYVRIEGYYKNICEIIDFMDDLFVGNQQ